MRDELIVEKIKEAVKAMDEIDDLINTQSIELQNADLELSDYYHLIENIDLNKEQSFIVVKRIHELRKIRRGLNNEHEIEQIYLKNENKMIGNNTRQFLLNDIYKTVKQLGKKYNNRILTEEKISEILEIKEEHKRPGRPKKNMEKNI